MLPLSVSRNLLVATGFALALALLASLGQVHAQVEPATTGSVTGQVIDADGAPLFGVLVTVYRQSTSSGAWEVDRQLRTGQGGVYRLDTVVTGIYRFGYSVDDGTWVPEFYSDRSTLATAASVPVMGNQVTLDPVVLSRGGLIQGRVTMFDGNKPDSLKIQVYAIVTGKLVQEQLVVGGTGAGAVVYTIGGLPEGQYTVAANGRYQGADYVLYYPDAETSDGALPVAVNPLRVTPAIDFVLGTSSMRGTINGRITGMGGVGIARASVTASTNDSFRRTVETNADGYYTFRMLSPGDYTIQAVSLDSQYAKTWYGNVGWPDQSPTVAVSAGQDTQGIDIQLIPAGNMKVDYSFYDGRITSGVIEIGLYRRQGPAASWERTALTTALAWGSSLKLTGLAPDNYRLGIVYKADSFDDFGPPSSTFGTYTEFFDDSMTVEGATDVQVTAGTTSTVQIELGRTPGLGEIHGIVSAANGTPLDNIYLVAQRWSGDRWLDARYATTGNDGVYDLDALLPGTYRLLATDRSRRYLNLTYEGSSPSQPLQVGADQQINGLVLVMDAGGQIAGVVRMFDGSRPGRLSFSLEQLVDNTWKLLFAPYVQLGLASEAQAYTIYGLPAGRYRLGVTVETGPRRYTTYYGQAARPESASIITVVPNTTTSAIDVTVGADLDEGVIQGRILVNRVGAAHLAVVLTRPSCLSTGVPLATVTTNEAGAFKFTALPAGLFCVVVPGAKPVSLDSTSIRLATSTSVVEADIAFTYTGGKTYLPLIRN